MTRNTRWIAAIGAVPVLLLGWVLAGWLTPHLLGSQPHGGWNAYGAYVGVLSEPAWKPHAMRIYLAGALGMSLSLLAYLACVVFLARRFGGDSDTPALSFAPSSWLAKAGYTGDIHGRILWGRRSRGSLTANGHVLVVFDADSDWQRDFVIPNTLHWEGPVLVVDHDGAARDASSGYRRTRAPVWYIDPFGADGVSTPWNPLAQLAQAGPGRSAPLRRLADGIYAQSPAHIRKEAIDAFIAVTSYLLDAYADAASRGLEPSLPTLGDVEQLMRVSDRSRKRELKRFADKPFTSGSTRTALQHFLRMPRDRFDYVMTIAHRPLEEISASDVQAALSGRGLDLDAWANGGGTLYVARRPDEPFAAAWLRESLLEQALQALLARGSGATALCIFESPRACGELPSLRRALYEAGARGIRVLQRTEGTSDWTRAYGEREADRFIDAFDLRIFAGTASSMGVPSQLFRFPDGDATRFDARRWPSLTSYVGMQRTERLVAVQRGIERPIRTNTLRYAKDPRLAARRLPPAEVSPPYGDEVVPSKTLISFSASAALALSATACTAGGQGADRGGGSAMQAPVYSDRLVEAKLGPKTFAFPMNLYSKQVGPDFQGGISLTIRWPDLNAFPPNASNEESFRDAYRDESINVRLYYVDKVPIESLPLRFANPSYAAEDDPLDRVSQRVKGELVHGLTPYYADIEKVTEYFRAKGRSSGHEHILEVSEDWFFSYDKAGQVQTFIQCDNREIRGASLVGGKLEWTPVGTPRGMCHHMFTVASSKIDVQVTYLRAYLADWSRIEGRIRTLIADAEMHGRRK